MTGPRPSAWLPDPLDDQHLRFWDGRRWTFHTAARPAAAPPTAEPVPRDDPRPPPVRRPDIAQALERVHGGLLGSMKEVDLLPEHLEPEERVVALTAAYGDGHGVLVCTNHRLLFLFVGIIRRQFLHVSWNQAKAVTYTQASNTFAVYTTKPTKRAVPALAVIVGNLTDAQTVAHAARTASAAPRLDIV
ncbi:DUF2510 domain-containing protein [Actinokineospora sp. 24-640]